MSENNGDNGLKANIPQEAIDAALRSVESRSTSGSDAGDSNEASVVSEDSRKLNALLEESMSRAAQTQERLKETHERYLRLAADFENWKKRAAREREDAAKFANEKILKDLILVIDNLERAATAEGDATALQNGVKLVLKQFSDTLGKHGITSFSAVGQPFDPSKHEALMQAESNDVPAGHVVSEMARGYLLNDRLARPAQVVVSRGPATVASESAGDAAQNGEDPSTIH
jgi:molecular chaperone GrpE